MLTMSYLDMTGPGQCVYKATNPEIGGRLSLPLVLDKDETSQARAVEAAQKMAEDARKYLGVTLKPSTDPTDYPPTPAPTPEEQTAAEALVKYQSRATAAPRVMARWAARNELALAAYIPPIDPVTGDPVPEPNPADYEDPDGIMYGEETEEYQAALAAWLEIYDPDTFGWAPRQFAGFMRQVGPVVILLNSLAFGATVAAVQGFNHHLATPSAKAAYIADMAAEGALP